MSKARVSQTTNNQNKSTKVASNVNANKVSSLPLPLPLPLPTASASRKLPASLLSRIEPWNHKQFLKRVSTFNSIKWHIKRIDINPLLCARFGWECIAKNTLKCTGCGTQIDYKTKNLYSIELDNKIASAFLQNIKSAHTPSCEWKTNECNKSFEYLPKTIIMKQQLIENITSWLVTDNNSFYFIPSIDESSKKVLFAAMQNHNKLQSFLKHDACLNIMLLCACGWIFNTNKYIQCQYCNKCCSLNSYHFKKLFQLLPQNNNSQMHALLHGIEEEANPNEEEEDISSILTVELPTNDTKSVMNRLSKLGLKMNANIIRSPHFQVYETKSLQKQANFNNHPLALSAASTSFASYKCDANGLQSRSMRWPKQSILTQPNSVSVSRSISAKKNKKRRRDQMSIEMNEDEDEDDDICDDKKSVECPRKRMRFSSSNSVDSGHSVHTVHGVHGRKNRKRKSMELECDESTSVSMVSSEFVPIIKKRRIDSDSLSSQRLHGSYRTPTANKQKRSRKRKFNNVFVADAENERKQIKRKRVDTPTIHQKIYFDPINLHNDYCPFKNKYKYERNEKNKNKNESDNKIGGVFGWNYCLKLVPNDIMYIQQISQSKKNESRKK